MPKIKKTDALSELQIKKVTTIQGGLLKKPLPLPIVSVQIGPESFEFARMGLKQEWLCRVITGEGPSRHPLSRTSLLRDLVQLSFDAVTDDRELDQLGLEAQRPADAMDALDMGVETSAIAEMAPKRNRNSKKRDKVNCIVTVHMREIAPEKDPECMFRREVQIWSTSNKKEVLLAVEHLPWAIQYMRDQYRLGGVPSAIAEMDVSRSAGLGQSPNTGSPSLSATRSISWDFSRSCWTAVVTVDKDKRQRQLKPAHIQLEEASLVKEDLNDLRGMDYCELKELAFKVLDRWASDVLQFRV